MTTPQHLFLEDGALNPACAWVRRVHDDACDSVQTDSDLVAGIHKPCNCIKHGRFRLPRVYTIPEGAEPWVMKNAHGEFMDAHSLQVPPDDGYYWLHRTEDGWRLTAAEAEEFHASGSAMVAICSDVPEHALGVCMRVFGVHGLLFVHPDGPEHGMAEVRRCS